MLNNPNTHKNCEKCLGGHYINCVNGKCIHNSTAKSVIGMMEAEFWKLKGTYRYIDKMICCSEFMKTNWILIHYLQINHSNSQFYR